MIGFAAHRRGQRQGSLKYLRAQRPERVALLHDVQFGCRPMAGSTFSFPSSSVAVCSTLKRPGEERPLAVFSIRRSLASSAPRLSVFELVPLLGGGAGASESLSVDGSLRAVPGSRGRTKTPIMQSSRVSADGLRPVGLARRGIARTNSGSFP